MKNDLILKYFQKRDQLTLDNKHYKKIVDDLLVWLFDNDNIDNDITSKLLFDTEKLVNARIISKEPMTLAGLEEIAYLLETFTDISHELLHTDGDSISENQIIIELHGEIKQILSVERILLNMLQRMSGIATETKTLVGKINNKTPFIAATRKTPWGLLDKKAVAVGGGLTHRLDLSDNILVKDNHLLHISPEIALDRIMQQTRDTLIEIEVEDEKTAITLIDMFLSQETTNILAILLDNFSAHKVQQFLIKMKTPPTIIFEASGGITKTNVTEWMKSGVDIVSLGALTHSPKAADLSMELL